MKEEENEVRKVFIKIRMNDEELKQVKKTIQIIDIKIDFVTLKNGKKSNHTG